jgi:hypothetical protein
MSEEKAALPSPSLEKGRVSEDEVAEFGGESQLPPPPTLTAEEEQALWRRIDLRLIPILSLMYLFSFMDRGMYAVDHSYHR